MIPGGEPYEAALGEGVTKVALRRGLSGPDVTELASLVALAASAINTTSPASVELIIEPTDAQIGVRMTGIKPSNPARPDAFAAFAAEAAAHTTVFSTEPEKPQITFAYPSG